MWRGAMTAGVALFAVLSWSGPASAAHVHVVRAGDTLYRIARHFRVRPAALAALNHLALTAVIHPGLRLAVPEDGGFAAGRAAPGRGEGPAPLAITIAAPDAFPASAAARSTLPSRSSFFGPAAARLALRFLGRPYQWSGLGETGFDCSGLVAHVFATIGRLLPHSSYAQYGLGVPVGRTALFDGDLVFFQTDGWGPSHVGIYIGAGRFVHASSSHGVAVASMEDRYFGPRFIGARRL